MALRKFNPITPGMRHKVLSKFEEITTDKPHKPLLEPIKKSGGRNSDGKMTMRYRGGGHKRRYRVIDFKRNKHMEATVLTVEYDPNRSSNICLVEYKDGEKRYIIAPEGLKPGMTIHSGKDAIPEVGHAMYLSDIPWVPLCTTSSCTPVVARTSPAVLVPTPSWRPVTVSTLCSSCQAEKPVRFSSLAWLSSARWATASTTFRSAVKQDAAAGWVAAHAYVVW